MRLAWFTPWPPQASGIAGRSVDATRALASRGMAIDVFVDRRAVPSASPAPADPPRPGDVRVQSAHDFVWRHHRRQYDLVIYQLGNSTAHAFIWPYLLRYPGLAILHDAHLHHARGAALIGRESADAYRAALAFDHPDVSHDAAELAIAGLDGTYYYLWPMLRSIVLASRSVGVHSRAAVAPLQAEYPDDIIEYVALGDGRDRLPDERARLALRQRLGLAGHAMLFGVFGGLTADKRVPEVLRALRALLPHYPHAHLLLAGAPDPHLDVRSLIHTLGLTSHVTVAPDLDDDRFDDAIAAVDVSLHLRWPTARATSGPWLRALAASKPTIVTDLAHQAHVPALSPQTWQPLPSASRDAPVTVAIDIVDEDHSLRLAMARLARDAQLRADLGAAARRYWEREHTVTRMTDDYVRLIERTLASPARASRLPAELRADPCRPAREWLAPFGPIDTAQSVLRHLDPA